MLGCLWQMNDSASTRYAPFVGAVTINNPADEISFVCFLLAMESRSG
jgi:hypothetical protein